jgi:hypothetical protein
VPFSSKPKTVPLNNFKNLKFEKLDLFFISIVLKMMKPVLTGLVASAPLVLNNDLTSKKPLSFEKVSGSEVSVNKYNCKLM